LSAERDIQPLLSQGKKKRRKKKKRTNFNFLLLTLLSFLYELLLSEMKLKWRERTFSSFFSSSLLPFGVKREKRMEGGSE